MGHDEALTALSPSTVRTQLQRARTALAATISLPSEDDEHASEPRPAAPAS